MRALRAGIVLDVVHAEVLLHLQCEMDSRTSVHF
jgi:hypothetical protein